MLALQATLGEITANLESIYNELGLSEEEKRDRDVELFNEIKARLQTHLAGATSEKEQLIAKCSALLQRLKVIAASLSDVPECSRYIALANGDVCCPYNSCLQKLTEATNTLEPIYDSRAKLFDSKVAEAKAFLERKCDLPIDYDDSPVYLDLIAHNSLESPRDLTMYKLNLLTAEIDNWQTEYRSRLKIVSQRASEITALWSELGTPQQDIETAVVEARSRPEALGALSKDMERLEKLVKELTQEKHSRQEQIRELQAQIYQLAEKFSSGATGINTHDDHSGSFVSERSFCESELIGLTPQVVEAYQNELARLQAMKKQYMHIFIEDCRRELQSLWGDLFYTDLQCKESFPAAFNQVFTDASLEMHEAEVRKLKEQLKELRPMCSLVSSYIELREDQRELERSSQDASRLMSKGAGGKRDPTRLLREEQMRKRLQKRKPKVVADLKQALDEWLALHGTPFMVYGESFLEVLQEENKTLKDPRTGRFIFNESCRSVVPPVSQSSLISAVKNRAPPGRRAAAHTNDIMKANTANARVESHSQRSANTRVMRTGPARRGGLRDVSESKLNSMNARPLSPMKPISPTRRAPLKQQRPVSPTKISPVRKTIPSTTIYADDGDVSDHMLRWRAEQAGKQERFGGQERESVFNWDKDTF